MPVKDWSVIERKRKTEKSCLKQLDWEEERVFLLAVSVIQRFNKQSSKNHQTERINI